VLEHCMTVIETNSLFVTSKAVAAEVGCRIPVAVSPPWTNLLQTSTRHCQRRSAVPCFAGPGRADDRPAGHG
jgi:hypothetical protein